jgi:hypothetical protein
MEEREEGSKRVKRRGKRLLREGEGGKEGKGGKEGTEGGRG